MTTSEIFALITVIVSIISLVIKFIEFLDNRYGKQKSYILFAVGIAFGLKYFVS